MCFVLLLSPLTGGANTPLTELSLLLCGLVLLPLSLFRLMSAGGLNSWRTRGALACFGLFVALLVFQMLPLPRRIVKSLSPRSEELYSNISALRGKPVRIRLSVDIHRTQRFLERFGAYAGILLTAVLIRRRRRLKFIMRSVGLCAGLTALFSLLDSGLPGTQNSRSILYKIFDYCVMISVAWLLSTSLDIEKRWAVFLVVLAGSALCYELVLRMAGYGRAVQLPLSSRRLSGAFENPNIFAGWLQMALPIVIGLALLEEANRRYLWTVIATGVILCILLSGSRGGIASTAVGLLFLVCFMKRRTSSPRPYLVPLFVGVWAVFVALYASIGQPFERFFKLLEAADARLEVWATTINIIRDFPLFGSGAGTFRRIILLHDPGLFPKATLTLTHNDYINFLSDTGSIGFGLLGGMVFFGLWESLGNCRSRSRSVGITASVCVAGVLAMLCHSAVDFNLQFPGNASFFLALLGIGMGVRNLRPHQNRRAVQGFAEPSEKAPPPK